MTISGPQTIATIEDACEFLRTALAESHAVELDLTAVTEADLAFVQLILATRKSAAAAGKALTWRMAADGPVAAALARSGLGSLDLMDDKGGSR